MGDKVLKVAAQFATATKEVAVATAVAAAGGPALHPLAGAIADGGFAVTVWPFVAEDADPVTDADTLSGMRELHHALQGVSHPLPSYEASLDKTRAALSSVPHGILNEHDSALLARSLDMVQAACDASPTRVVHGENSILNRLSVSGRAIFIDFEGTLVAPPEWDLAVWPDALLRELWPEHDPDTLSYMRLGIYARTSVYCWRHAAARPESDNLRWHAEHHLANVRTFLARE
ncbi:MAG: hypothetical protein QOK43_2008 [Acidimicrobiaceae bacterium]|nr:hypothetical protein [Acidimicrobiaceae bacterium]